MTFSNLEKCKLIDLPRVRDTRGSLSFIENGENMPFSIQRLYYIYDVPGGESRGAHAHKELMQIIIAMSGSFQVELTDGANTKSFTLSTPYVGLFVDKLIWRNLKNFSSGAVCAVLASMKYDESDYIRDYEKFLSGEMKND